MRLKKFYAALTAAVIMGGAVPALSSYSSGISVAASTFTDENGNEYTKGEYGDFTYLNYGDHIEVSVSCQKASGELDIPAEIDGLPVTAIRDNAFYGCLDLEYVTIPDTVTSIGESAFGMCLNLKGITIPEGVTSIGDSAFVECWALESIELPDSIESMGSRAFAGCDGLTSIKLPENLTRIKSETFSHCVKLSAITIPKNVLQIDDGAFYNCESLTSVIIPVNVKYLWGSSTFTGCTGLTDITFLNPSCTIGADLLRGSNAKVFGFKDSMAENCAKRAGLKFVPIDKDTLQSTVAGDANCDGDVNMADAILIMQAVANPDKYDLNGTEESRITGQGWKNGDVCDNDGITVKDALGIQMYMLKLVDSLPIIE